jgi:hypothetical protein
LSFFVSTGFGNMQEERHGVVTAATTTTGTTDLVVEY